MKMLLTIMAVLFLSIGASAQHTEAILNAYLNVKNSLVKSDNKQAIVDITSLQKAIEKSDDFKEKDALLKSVQKMSKATDLEKQRTAFADVSILLWAFVKKADNLNQSIYYQYCPMKKTYWLSNESTVKNPYYGSKMLTCGKVVEEI